MNHLPEGITNLGVIEGRRDTDWLAGTIPFEERLPSGDWRPFLPPGEWQADHGVDTLACVTFSALNCIETQLNFYQKGVNLSDRFTAKMSGTTQLGNHLYKVADSIRNDGVVLEALWPAPQNFTWDSYYLDIPQGIRDAALRPTVRYEFLVDTSKESLTHHLKQSPLQVVLPGHAVMLFACEEDIHRYFDSYSPFQKEWTSNFGSVLKLVYYDQEENAPMTAKQVRKLQALEGFHDEEGIAYWTGKRLEDYLNARLPDKKKEIEDALAA